MKAQDNTENKTLEFLFQERAIHFLVNPNDENVMVNATEMAKLFDRRIDFFLKTDGTKKYIAFLEKKMTQFPPKGGNSKVKIIETRGHMGTYFHQKLALKFAMWLDMEFEDWVYDKILEVVTQNTKQVQSVITYKAQKKREREELIKKAVKENNKALLDLLKVDKAIAKADYQEKKAIKELKSQYKMDL